MLLPLVSGMAQADWQFGAEAGRTHESNLPRAQLQSDIRSDSAWVGAAAATHVTVFDDGNSLTAGVDLRSTEYDTLTGLSYVSLGGSVGLRSKFGLGWQAPWLKIQGRTAREVHRNASRNAWRSELGATLGKRFTEQFEVFVGLAAERLAGDLDNPVVPGISGAVFDLRSRTLSLRANYDFSETLQVQGGYGVRYGDVVSSTRRNSAIFRASSAIARDPVYGPDYFAYTLQARTQTASFGLSQSLGPNTALSVGLVRSLTSAPNNLDYQNTSAQVTYTYQY